MPGVGGTYVPHTDLDWLDDNASSVPTPQGARDWQSFSTAIGDTWNRLHNPRLLESGNPRAFGVVGGVPMAPMEPDTGAPQLTPDEANERYGTPTLRFNAPLSEADAAWQSAQHRSQEWNDAIFADTRPTPLTDFGLSLAGGLLDPGNVGLMAATDGFGEAALAGLGWRSAEGATGFARVANALRTPVAGAVGMAPFVGADAAMSYAAGEPYDASNGLIQLAAGAILHTGFHALGMSARERLADDTPGAPEPKASEFDDLVPQSGVPDAVDALPEATRQGAFVKALDDASDDRPVDVGRFVEREQTPSTLSGLDEDAAQPSIASWRPVESLTEAGPAITPRGTEVPVRYGLAELADLTTSHDDQMSVNPDFPPELQPRDRERAGAQARNLQLQSELNPKLLMTDTAAGAGAPIVAPDGVVESGNGRTIALRRSAADGAAGRPGGAAYARYKAELAARFPEAADMHQPVLVRARSEPLTGVQRAALAREMNADVVERMSAGEQAMADARAIDPAMLAHLDGSPLGKRNFTKAFLARVAPDQINQLTSDAGHLSQAGEDRLDAALTAKAYGDPRLVDALHEDAATHIKAIGDALKRAAPAWAAMRGAMAAGKVPAELDVTAALRSAVDLVRHARDARLKVPEFLAERLAQTEMFAGSEISEETEGFLRLIFRNEDFTQPRSAVKVGEALEAYARDALEFKPGPNLFGETLDGSTARQLLANLAKRFADGDDGEPDLLRPPGKPDGVGADEPGGGEGGAADDALFSLRGDERGEPGDQGLQPEGEPGAAGAGGGADAGGSGGLKPQPKRGAAAIAADPELKALAADTERLAAMHGVEPEAVPAKEDPNTLADALHAAAVCLEGEL